MWTPLLAFLPLIAAMRVDPERIAARLRIEAEIANDRGETPRSERGRRQLQPKEISIQVSRESGNPVDRHEAERNVQTAVKMSFL